MNKLIISIVVVATASTVLASTFKVSNPVITKERISVPISNIFCKTGPFKLSQLQVKLPKPVGSPIQSGTLMSPYMDSLDDDECNAIIMNLIKFAHGDEVDLEAIIETRSVVKLIKENSYNCEGAQQEVVSMRVGRVMLRESIFDPKGELNCPEGINPNHVSSLNSVIYVLHEDGIPTKSDF